MSSNERSIALDTISRTIQQWLDWQERQHASEGLRVTDLTHLMRVPEWPSRGVLKAWVRALNEASGAVETESAMREYYRWWSSITREGDPSRRPNLSIDSFKAGWHAHSMAPEGGWPEERGAVETSGESAIGIVSELRAEVVVPYKDGYEPMRAPPSKLMTRAADEIERLTGDFQQVHNNCIHAREVADRALKLVAAVDQLMPDSWLDERDAVQDLAKTVPPRMPAVETTAPQPCEHGVPRFVIHECVECRRAKHSALKAGCSGGVTKQEPLT